MRLALSLISCFVMFSTISAANQRLDGIVAVVGDSVILSSELDAFTLLWMNQKGIKPDSVRMDTIQKTCLNALIDEKVLLIHAQKDSTIQIKEDEVEDALNRQIKSYMQQGNFTAEQLEQEIQKANGMTMQQFKLQMRKNLREYLLKQKVQQQYVSAERISRKEVESFYNAFKDSLPSAGKSVRLSELVVRLAPSDSIKQIAYEKIRTIKQKLDNGENFQSLAKQYSNDPAAANGGDLGFISKGSTDFPIFEEKAFSLKVGQISDVFETPMGFHLIMVEEKKDQKVHVRQILIQVAARKAEIDHAMARLDSIRASCKTREQFSAAVKQFCTDPAVRARSGDRGWQSLYEIPEAIRPVMDSAAVGFISQPVAGDAAYALFRLDNRNDDRKYTLEDDYALLADNARQRLAQKKLLDLVKKWRNEVYIDVRL